MRIPAALCVAAAQTLAGLARAQPATLTAPAIAAFVAAQTAAEARHDWPAVRTGYTQDAHIFGLYYDKDHMPHVHDGAAVSDLTTMAALSTIRRNSAAAAAPGAVTIAPGGQRATVSFTRTDDYDQGSAHVHRVFDQTAIVTLQEGSVKFVQVVSVERPRQ